MMVLGPDHPELGLYPEMSTLVGYYTPLDPGAGTRRPGGVGGA